MRAAIVTVGDEILIGQVVDTNSAYIANELNQIGISVYRIISISDSKDEIFNVLHELIPEIDLLLITGGLGPTSDDITKPALAEFFNTRLALNDQALENINNFLARRNVLLSDRNRDQALLPENCIPVPNQSGTAFGMWFEKDGRIIISMPGVPFEMKEMMKNSIIPRLRKIYSLFPIIHKTILTTGIAESVMADRISDWEQGLPENIKLAYLPSPGILRLRLSAYQSADILSEQIIDKEIVKLKKLLGPVIFGYDQDTLEGVAGKLLTNGKSTLSIAESCTGGYISHLITSVPGASNYFSGEITSYSNSVKTDILQVDKQVLNKFGAVSKQVVLQMVEKVRILLNSDYSLAVSGIAGPDGGTPDKPVGTVWIAVASKNQSIAKEFHFGDIRERNIQRASIAALNMLRLYLTGNQSYI